MAPLEPDLDRDVIVKHVHRDQPESGGHGRWIVFLGSAKRGELESAQAACVFARLLADLVKRPMWIDHEREGLEPLDPGSIRGGTCC